MFIDVVERINRVLVHMAISKNYHNEIVIRVFSSSFYYNYPNNVIKNYLIQLLQPIKLWELLRPIKGKNRIL